MIYTVIELAVLRTRRELDAARELIALPRADLAMICQSLGLRTNQKLSHFDLMQMIMAKTHPRQAQAALATGDSSAQLGMF